MRVCKLIQREWDGVGCVRAEDKIDVDIIGATTTTEVMGAAITKPRLFYALFLEIEKKIC